MNASLIVTKPLHVVVQVAEMQNLKLLLTVMPQVN